MIIYTCNILRGHDYRWLENAEHCITDAAQDANISWNAYHVEQQQAREFYPAIFSVLPMFPDDSKSMAMICHALNVIRVAVKELNPAQVPIVTLDQPLYCKAGPVVLAGNAWRRTFCHHTRWSPHRNVLPEDDRRMAARSWMDGRNCASQSSISWHSRIPFKGLPCQPLQTRTSDYSMLSVHFVKEGIQ